MRLVLILGGVVALVVAGFAVYLRWVPSDPNIWHVDPRTVVRPSAKGSYLLGGMDGDGPAPRFAASPDEILAKFDAVALATPNVTPLAGTVAEGHVTYIARSKVFGFPDYISVVAYEQDGGTAMAIYSRLRFGSSDMGVNRRRIDAWLAAIH